MPEYERLKEKARKRLHTANHLLTVTYPAVKDAKLMLPILENVYYAYENGMNALLEFDRSNKAITALPQSFGPRWEVFKEQTSKKHNVDETHLETLQNLRGVLGSHKKSPIEFTRGEKYVICDDDFITETLTEDKLKAHLRKARAFLTRVVEDTRKNERIVG